MAMASSTRRPSAILALAAFAALLPGCPGRIADPVAFREEAAARCPTAFDVERDLFARTCGTLGCHTGGPGVAAAGLDFATPGVRDRLLAHVSSTEECDGRPLLVPGDLAGSLLVQKVGESPPCGDRMPSGLSPLNPTEQACLSAYVAALVGGSADGGAPPPTDAGAPPPIDAGGGAPTAVTYQAEAMTLGVYVIDATDANVIRLPDGATSGTARQTFDGVAGTYQLTVAALAEMDGQPRLVIRVAGTEVANETYPLAAAATEPLTLGPYTVVLAPGDEILLEGFVDAGAWARVDYVRVAP